MPLNGLNIIGFEHSGKGTKTFRSTDPASLERLDTDFHEATGQEVSAAVIKATEAFVDYRQKSPEDRAAFLDKIAEEILVLGDELIHRCMKETALPEGRLTGERTRTMNQLKLFASVLREGSWVDARIDTARPDREPLPKPDIRQVQVPLGPVGVFGASNFPLAFSVAGGDTASALAAGCPVVVKGHPLHPGASELVGNAINEAAKKTGMPEGVFSLVQGPSVDVGMAIVQHPQITAIGFTGSFKGGKALFDEAGKRETPIPVFAEMGSTNPVFILPGALKERTDSLTKGLVGSITLGVGQFCTNPGIIVTEKTPESDVLMEKMHQGMSQAPASAMLGEGIHKAYKNGVARLMEISGVSLVASGTESPEGYYGQPNLLVTDAEIYAKNPILGEEVFGPSSLHVQASGKEELLALAKGLEGHLTATIHGTNEDLLAYSELVRVLEQKVGRIIFNGYPTGVEVCHSMVHGGPFPATTAPQTTSVGTAAIKRFTRPVCYQDFPEEVLPDALKSDNPQNIWRLVDGSLTKNRI